MRAAAVPVLVPVLAAIEGCSWHSCQHKRQYEYLYHFGKYLACNGPPCLLMLQTFIFASAPLCLHITTISSSATSSRASSPPSPVASPGRGDPLSQSYLPCRSIKLELQQTRKWFQTIREATRPLSLLSPTLLLDLLLLLPRKRLLLSFKSHNPPLQTRFPLSPPLRRLRRSPRKSSNRSSRTSSRSSSSSHRRSRRSNITSRNRNRNHRSNRSRPLSLSRTATTVGRPRPIPQPPCPRPTWRATDRPSTACTQAIPQAPRRPSIPRPASRPLSTPHIPQSQLQLSRAMHTASVPWALRKCHCPACEPSTPCHSNLSLQCRTTPCPWA